MPVKNNKSIQKNGFTMMEVLVVLVIMSILLSVSIAATAYLKSSRENEKAVLEVGVNDAIIGYYSVVGKYPDVSSLGLGMSTSAVSLTSDQAFELSRDLQRYSGYAYLPDEILNNYQFLLYYPNEYVFKIYVESRY